LALLKEKVQLLLVQNPCTPMERLFFKKKKIDFLYYRKLLLPMATTTLLQAVFLGNTQQQGCSEETLLFLKQKRHWSFCPKHKKLLNILPLLVVKKILTIF